MTITTRSERPIFFDAGGDELFGVFTAPEGPPLGTAVLTLFGAGPFPTLGKNQVRVRLARELAELGFHVLRMDYRGIGESGGEPREADLSELWVDDVLGAIHWLQGQGFERIVIVGVCFGARTALAAVRDVPELAGMVLIAPPVGEANHRESILAHPWSWYVRRALSMRSLRLLLGRHPSSKRRRGVVKEKLRQSTVGTGSEVPGALAKASPSFLAHVGELLDRNIPVLFLYGRGDDFYRMFEESMSGRLGRMIRAASPRAAVQVFDGSLAGLASVEVQQLLLDEVIGWGRQFAAGGPAHASHGRG